MIGPDSTRVKRESSSQSVDGVPNVQEAAAAPSEGPDEAAVDVVGDLTRPVKSAERTLALLERLAEATEPPTFAQLARHLRIPKSSLHALLKTLERNGWVELDVHNSHFSLGSRALAFAASYLHHDHGVRFVQDAMRQISADVGETVQFARLDGSDIIYLAQLPARHPVQLVSALGTRLPAHATALGKSLLAWLDEDELDNRLSFPLPALTDRTLTQRSELYEELRHVRAQGFAEDHEEAAQGLFCFAITVPSTGLPTDAISVSVPSFRLTENTRQQIVSVLRRQFQSRSTSSPLGSLHAASSDTEIHYDGTDHASG
jgi:DNA-binding IclR family transcriptional regulator